MTRKLLRAFSLTLCLAMALTLFAPGAMTANAESGSSGLYPPTIAGGEFFTLAVKSDGTVMAWGDNRNGQLGDGTTVKKTEPVQVHTLTNIVSVAAGTFHSLAVDKDGGLWAWGQNTYGQLGDGTKIAKNEPVKVMDDVAMATAGYYFTLAVKKDGTLWAWGHNTSGQVGNGTVTTQLSPVKILENVKRAAAGATVSFAIQNDGSLWGWGYNNFGQVGNGAKTNQTTPVKVLSDVVSVAGGVEHALAVQKDGSLYVWGQNDNGQLGTGSRVVPSWPQKVTMGYREVFKASNHSLAVTSDGTLFTWGYNFSGELGDGTSVMSKDVPVRIMSNVACASSGKAHSMALTEDGKLYVWGGNGWGQLGDGTSANKLTPMLIMEDILLPGEVPTVPVDDKPIITSLSVTTPTIVETLSAYLNISAEGEYLEGKAVTAYFKAGDELKYETELTLDGGKWIGRMKVDSAPAKDIVCGVVVKVDGGEPQGDCPVTLAAYNPAALWNPVAGADADSGKLALSFSEVIGHKSGGRIAVTVDGVSKSFSLTADSRAILVDVAYGDVPGGAKVVASGVKYPGLFPSYSFTFTALVNK